MQTRSDMGRHSSQLEGTQRKYQRYPFAPPCYVLIHFLILPLLAVPPIKRPSRAIPLKPKGYWLKPGNVREFLIHFAETQEFDPLRPENWSSITYAQIHATPVRLSLSYVEMFSISYFLLS